MAIFEVTFDVDELDKVLEDMSEDVMRARASIMAQVAELLVAAVSDRYESEGDGEWPGHSESYIKYLTREYGGDQNLMVLSDVLATSTEPRHGPGFAEASTSVPYVVYHLEGGDIIPKRNPFELRDAVLDEIEDYILDQLGKAAGG